MNVRPYRLAVSMAVVMAAGLSHGSVGTSASGQSGSRPAPGILMRRLWTFRPPPFNRHAPEGGMGAVSPDGRYFSFRDHATGDLMLHDFQTGDDRRLTKAGDDPKEYAEDSVISRDGKHISYAWFVNGGFEIRVLDLTSTTSQPRVLFSNHEAAPLIFPYDWSADGKWIATQVVRNDRTSQIAVISTADGVLRVLKSLSDSRRAEVMAFSPDGRFLAYDSGATLDASQHDVFVIATDASGQTTAMANQAHDVVIGWTPEGTDLLFASDRGGSGGVWALPMVDGKADGQPRLIKGDVSMRPRGLTRTGALYFSTTISMQEIYVASVDLTTGKLLDPPPRRIAGPTAGFNLGAEWSPDGQSLAYLPRKDVSVVAIQSAATGAVRELHPDLDALWAERPLWSRDGRFMVAIAQDRKRQWGLYRIDAQTGATTMLVRSDDFANNPVHPVGWSADGELLYFRRRSEVSTLDTRTGRQRVVEGVRGMFGLSPDGRAWAWVDGARPVHDPRPGDRSAQDRSTSVVLYLMPVEGGQPRELLRVTAPEDLRAPTWSPDGKYLVFFKVDTRDPDQTMEVWSIPVEGGTPRRIDVGDHVPAMPVNDAELNKSIRIHPDGHKLAIEAMEPEAEVWAMENLMAQFRATPR